MATAERIDAGSSPARVSSEILDRLPPQNLDAERAVLGSLMLKADLCDEIALILRPEDFHSDAHQKLFAQLLAMHEEGKQIERRTTRPRESEGWA